MSAPILNNASPFIFPAIAEDSGDSIGVKVSDIFSINDVTDENGIAISAGIAITNINSQLGQFQYKLNDTSEWQAIQANRLLSNGTPFAFLLNTDAWIRFFPLNNISGSMSNALTFCAWNQLDSSSGSFIDVSVDTFLNNTSLNTELASVTVNPVNDAPYFTGIQSGIDVFTENSSTPILLASNVSIEDIELSSLNNGAGNYAGATFTLQRTDGSRTEDIFSGLNSLKFNRSGSALLNNLDVGTFTNSNGILSITFNENASQASVNSVLSNIGYKNTSNAPESILSFTWSFSDGNLGAQGSGDALVTSTTSSVNVSKINDAPRITINSSVESIYTEGSSPAIVAPSARLYDSELSALNNSLGNYSGSKLTLTRSDGAHTEDVFSGTGTLSFSNNSVLLNGVHVGRVSNSSGLLTIIFNSNATQLSVNQVASQIGYANTSNRPVSSVSLTWFFSDENTGEQGSNGILSATNTSIVNITPTDDLGRLSISGGTALGDTLRANISDPDGLPRNVRYQWMADGSAITAASGGTLFLTASMLGKAISVRAIYDDTFGSHTIISEPTAPVGGRSLTNNNDDYTGTSSIDWVLALDGNDYLRGNGSDDSLDGGNGNDTIDGGIGADHMMGGIGDDVYYIDNLEDAITENRNEGADTVYSSATFTLTTNLENLILIGSTIINGAGNSLSNRITGNAASNFLEGFSGNDTLDGGIGSDTLKGGRGDDVYYLENTADTAIESRNAGIDTVYSSTSRILGVNLENLVLTGRAISGTGNELDNFITGNSISNSIFGGIGNDTLNGGASNDTLNGGVGNDTYYVDSDRDFIIDENGIDSVISTVTWTLGSSLENLTLFGSLSIDGTGNNLNNEIIGNNSDNKLDGGLGDDTLSGGNGSDTYYVDSRNDIIIEESSTGGTDTVISTFSKKLTGSLRFIENITLIGSAKNATGNTLDNLIKGNTLDNLLIGNNGNDTLDGGIGFDTMDGGNGDDVYRVNAIGDNIIELENGGNDTVISTISMEINENIENLKLEGLFVANAIGNSANNLLTGNDANNLLRGNAGDDTLNGGGGIDTLEGGDGDDIYYIDNVNDVVVENNRRGGSDVIFSNVTRFLGDFQENITLIGNDAINATGNNLNNIIIGNNASNALNGQSGADTMQGAAGNDIYYVDNRNDKVIESNIDDGIDTIMSSVSFTLGDFIENLILGNGSSVNGTGNNLNNYITGNTSSNRLIGEDGADTLDGGIGEDRLIGGNGDDTYIVDNSQDLISETISNDGVSDGIDTVQSSINWALGNNLENLFLTGSSSINGMGNSLNNNIIGNSGANSINGSGGDDTLDGGYGADTLSGGSGADSYVVDTTLDVVKDTSSDESIDTVNSFVSWSLGNYVENLNLLSSASINGIGNNLNNIINGNRSNNLLDGKENNDTLNGGAGQDTLIGGSGSDVFILSLSEDSPPSKATWDIINDFTHGEDYLDLSAIDANSARNGDQAFTRMITGTNNFTAAGQLKFYNETLYGNTDADASAEFAIQLIGITHLALREIIL